MSDVTIPEDIRNSAERALNTAQDEHDKLFNPLSNSISEGLWKRFIEHSARAILAERDNVADRADRCAEIYGNSTGQRNAGAASALRQFAHDIRSSHD